MLISDEQLASNHWTPCHQLADGTAQSLCGKDRVHLPEDIALILSRLSGDAGGWRRLLGRFSLPMAVEFGDALSARTFAFKMNARPVARSSLFDVRFLNNFKQFNFQSQNGPTVGDVRKSDPGPIKDWHSSAICSTSSSTMNGQRNSPGNALLFGNSLAKNSHPNLRAPAMESCVSSSNSSCQPIGSQCGSRCLTHAA